MRYFLNGKYMIDPGFGIKINTTIKHINQEMR